MFNFHRHCWHEVKDTRRKIRIPTRCKYDDPKYIQIDYESYYCGRYIKIKFIEECCICHKQRINYSMIHDIETALFYPDSIEFPLTLE